MNAGVTHNRLIDKKTMVSRGCLNRCLVSTALEIGPRLRPYSASGL
jgi:hypothetical protein